MTLCSGGVSVGEGLLQTELPPKEAAQLSGAEKYGFSTSSAWGRDHEAENGPIIGHTVSAFLWGGKYEAERGPTAGDTGFSKILALEHCKY